MAPTKFLLLASSSALLGQNIDIARTAQNLPNENINFGTFTVLNANGDGNFLFVNRTATPGVANSEDEFLFVFDAAGNLTRAITEGETSPDGQGTLGTLSFLGELGPILGQNGTVALTNILQGTSDPRTVLAWDAAFGLRLIAREGDDYPDGSNDDFEDFLKPVSVSQTGSVTLTAMRDEEIIFQELSNQNLTTIRPRVISGNFLRQLRKVDATDSGQIVLGSLYRQSSPSLSTTGIFDIQGGAIINRALKGDPAPTSGNSTDGIYASVVTDFRLNASRAIAYFATVEDETVFGDGIFFQQSSSAPTQAVIRANDVLTGGALGNRQATFVGISTNGLLNTGLLLADDATVYVSGPILIDTETTSRAALIRWTPNSSPEVLLVGDEILPDANPVVALDEIILQDVSGNGAVSFQAQASNGRNYPLPFSS